MSKQTPPWHVPYLTAHNLLEMQARMEGRPEAEVMTACGYARTDEGLEEYRWQSKAARQVLQLSLGLPATEFCHTW